MVVDTKHTPGPWHIDRTNNFHGGRPYGIRSGPQGLSRRNIVNWGGIASPASPESEANARLIASAPDMFEALEKIELYCGQGDMHGARKIARDAISKATAQ